MQNQKPPISDLHWEKVDADIYRPKPSRIIFKILLFVLLGIIVLGILAACLIHPLDKLSVRLLLSGSYTIDIFGIDIFGSSGNQRIYVDGNRIRYFDGKHDHYYEIEGDTLYCYKKTTDGQWEKTVDSQLADNSDPNLLTTLLDKENYQKVKGEYRVYETKPGVKLSGAQKVEYTIGYDTGSLIGGRYHQFTLKYKDSTTQISIYDLGKTKVTFPWEK